MHWLQSSSGSGSLGEVKFSILYLPGGGGGEEIHLCILGSLSESWHLRAATYVQGQKYPLVVIPF